MKKLFILAAFTFLSAYSYSQIGPCIGSSSLTITPGPDSLTGCYLPGTTVTVCITINDYLQTGSDWLCGVVPTFGPGWDSTTLAPVSASNSCDGQGNWAWYTSCTSTNTGLTLGPGFYYDSPLGSPAGTLDGIPGNNFGDNCTIYSWTFCFQVATNVTGGAGATGSIGVYAYGDNIAGSWGQDGCVDSAITTNYCIVNCTVVVPTVVTTDITTCFGDSTGGASVTPAAGYPPYTYLWSNGATTQSISNVTGGVYSVIVGDSSGCQKTVYLQIQQPQEIMTNATVIPIGCGTSGTGSITTNASGGVAPYTYLWNTGATTNSLTGLAAGTYILTVTDSSGCTKTDSMTITNVPPLTIVSTSTGETCGASNGTATITATGTPPYTYLWTPPVSTGPTATGLSQGTYIVQVTDSNGCIATDTITINAIATFTTTTAVNTANCTGTGGSATISVTGSSGPYTYQWSPSGGTDSTAVNLNAGTYTVVITDINSCSQTVTVVIPQLSSTVTVTLSVTQLPCDTTASSTITATAGNGTAPYTYLWSNGATSSSINGLGAGIYTVTATDANQCSATSTGVITLFTPITFTCTPTPTCPGSNSGTATLSSVSGGTSPYTYQWSDGSTNSVITGLAPGTYTVTVIDAFGCTSSSTFIVTENPVVSVSAGSNTTICNGQSATITAIASGGTPAFSYSWSTGSTLSSLQVNPASTTTYTVTVTDAANCQATASVTVNVENYPVISVTPNSTICEGNSVSLSVSGGSSGTTYSWQPSTGLSNSTISNPVASPGVNTYYYVTASNGNCSTIDSVEITVIAAPIASFIADTTHGTTVAFTNTSTGGTAYLWDFGDGTTSTDMNPTHIYPDAGSFTVSLVVTNSNGCTDTAEKTLEYQSSLFIPNVFTPNGDGNNDMFSFKEYGLKSVNTEIYNRWGLKVYEWNKLLGGWNGFTSSGDFAPDGTYFYVVKATGLDTKTYDLSGTVTLIRKN